jgi:hypothetical protein
MARLALIIALLLVSIGPAQPARADAFALHAEHIRGGVAVAWDQPAVSDTAVIIRCRWAANHQDCALWYAQKGLVPGPQVRQLRTEVPYPEPGTTYQLRVWADDGTRFVGEGAAVEPQWVARLPVVRK